MEASRQLTRDNPVDLPSEDADTAPRKPSLFIRSGRTIGYMAKDGVAGLLQISGFGIGTAETVPGAGKAVTALLSLLGWMEHEAHVGRMKALTGSAKRRVRRAYRRLLAQGDEANVEDVRDIVAKLPIPQEVIDQVIAKAIRDEDVAQTKKASKAEEAPQGEPAVQTAGA